MYYFDIISAICFLIDHCLFSSYMAFSLVRRYSTNNSDNNVIDNNKDKRIYREINTPDSWWTIQQALIDSGMKNATIITVLLATDRIMLTEHAEDKVQWLVYLNIRNLSYEIQKSWVKPRKMMVGFIRTHKVNLLIVKTEIYYQIIGIIIKGVYNHRPTNITNEDWFLFLALGTLGCLYIIALETVVIESILIICIDRNIWQCHLIIGGMSVDYKQQIVITCIKTGMQCSICHVVSEKCKNLCKVWPRQSDKNVCA